MLGDLRFELREVLLQLVDLLQALDRLRRRVGVFRAGDDAGVAQAVEQLLALLDEADLLLAVQSKLRIHPFERGEVDADLLRQLAGVPAS